MSQRTLWEEGHESGRQVAVLGVALALTSAVLDLWLFESLTLLFDICFVLLCVAIALLVRPKDFFTVGVLPPLLMVVVFTLLGATRPEVVAGLGHHAGALVTGYLLCLAILAIRHRVLGQAASKRDGSPAPTRTTSG